MVGLTDKANNLHDRRLATRLPAIVTLATSLLRSALRRKAQVELARLSDFTLHRLGLDRAKIPAAAEAYSRGAWPFRSRAMSPAGGKPR